jgi:hypothetical protein
MQTDEDFAGARHRHFLLDRHKLLYPELLYLVSFHPIKAP